MTATLQRDVTFDLSEFQQRGQLSIRALTLFAGGRVSFTSGTATPTAPAGPSATALTHCRYSRLLVDDRDGDTSVHFAVIHDPRVRHLRTEHPLERRAAPATRHEDGWS